MPSHHPCSVHRDRRWYYYCRWCREIQWGLGASLGRCDGQAADTGKLWTSSLSQSSRRRYQPKDPLSGPPVSESRHPFRFPVAASIQQLIPNTPQSSLAHTSHYDPNEKHKAVTMGLHSANDKRIGTAHVRKNKTFTLRRMADKLEGSQSEREDWYEIAELVGVRLCILINRRLCCELEKAQDK